MRPAHDHTITLTKHHGLGNDFLIAVDPPRPLTPADAVVWCDRREGIGADGLIQATSMAAVPGASDGSDRWRMVLFNSDGGRAEISGNGLRCLAQALADHHGHDRSTDHRLSIETDAGTRVAVVAARSIDDGPAIEDLSATDRVRVGMGKAVEGPAPSQRWSELGVAITDQLGVDLGNPHLVGFVDEADELDGYDMAEIGPTIEADHPGGLNVHLVRIIDRSHLEMIIWERGAGVTMACGSGACAAAWTAARAGLVDGADGVEVAMPGGSATVAVTDDEVVLTGPAVRIGEVRLDG